MEFKRVAEGDDFEVWEAQDFKKFDNDFVGINGEKGVWAPHVPKKIGIDLLKKVSDQFTDIESLSMSKSAGVSVRIKKEVKK